MDDYLRGLSPFDPNGSLSNADADRIWVSYKAAGGGGPVKIFGESKMDPTFLASLGGLGGGVSGGGGLLSSIMSRMNPTAPSAPTVPADGSMQPTIGPGTAPPAAPTYTPRLGLPKGGLLGIMQGGQPNGIAGLLQHFMKQPPAPGQPLTGPPPGAGMLPGMPGSPQFGPAAPPPPQLPPAVDINPMNQF